MISNNKIFLFLFLCVLVPCGAFASGKDISALKASWKNPKMSYCYWSDLKNATIGKDKDTCKGGYSIDNNTPSQCSLDGSNMGVLMLVARDVNEHGAYFCPTTIHAKHRSQGNAWTLYAEPAQGTQSCYWLCKTGYSGDHCGKTTSDGCDSVPLKRSDFDNLTMSNSPQVETSISMFHLGERDSCDVNYNQEHDMILAVSDWLPSGHGAWATPFVVRARREAYDNDKSGVEVWAAGEATLLCKNGYTANAAENDCVAIDEAACGLTKMCENWPSILFDTTTMVLEYNSDEGCYKYRCRESGYAFLSSEDKTCQPCATNLRGGVLEDDGTCVICDVGKIFDSNAVSTGFCSETVAYDKRVLQYGKGKDKHTDIAQQCWTILEPTDYINCVKGNTTATTGNTNTFIRVDLTDTNEGTNATTNTSGTMNFVDTDLTAIGITFIN